MTWLDIGLLLIAFLLIIVLIIYKFTQKTSTKFGFAVLTGFISITSLFYVLPIRKVIFVHWLNIPPPAPPSNAVYAIFALTLMAIYALFKYNSNQSKTDSLAQTSNINTYSLPEINTHSLPEPTTNKLIGRAGQLSRIKNAFKRDTTHIFSLIAGGGVGKSALTYKWVQWLTQDKNLRGTSKVFAWSFYSQGQHQTHTSSAPFFDKALPFFGFTGEIPSDEIEKARTLADLLYQQDVVLILDGFEPLQHPVHILDGEIADGAIKELLRCIKRDGLGGGSNLLLISSRQAVVELAQDTACIELPLETLNPKDGMALLKNLGCKGTQDELEQASTDMGGHALALVLMAKLLVKDFYGEIQRRDCLPDLFAAEKLGGHALRVVEYYDKVYWSKTESKSRPDKSWRPFRFFQRFKKNNPPAERALLQCLGLFDRPMDLAEQQVLFEKADIAHPLSDLNPDELEAVNQHLQYAGLLLSSDTPRTQWDTHPIIRTYFAKSLRQQQPKLYQQAQQVLFEYYQSVPDKPQPDTIEALQPLYRAVVHGCLAGLYQQALDDVYEKRILRGDEFYSLYKLGSYAHDLTALSAFFNQDWQAVNRGLTSPAQAWLLALAPFCLMSMGRLAEAVVPRRVGMEMRVKQQDWKNASISARNLVDLYLPLAQLPSALQSAQSAIDYANNSKGLFEQMAGEGYLATSKHRLGDLDGALQAFQRAEQIQAQRQTQYPQLYSIWGYQYCALLLDRAKTSEAQQAVLARGQYSLNIVKNLLSIAFDQLTIAQASNNPKTFGLAVDAMRTAGKIEFMPIVLLARAKHYRLQQQFKPAQDDLDEARDIIDRCGMKLYLIDALLLQANLDLDQGKQPKEQTSPQLHRLIETSQYKLRQPELTLLDCRIALHNNQLEQAKSKRQQAHDELKKMGYWGLLPAWESVVESFNHR